MTPRLPIAIAIGGGFAYSQDFAVLPPSLACQNIRNEQTPLVGFDEALPKVSAIPLGWDGMGCRRLKLLLSPLLLPPRFSLPVDLCPPPMSSLESSAHVALALSQQASVVRVRRWKRANLPSARDPVDPAPRWQTWR